MPCTIFSSTKHKPATGELESLTDVFAPRSLLLAGDRMLYGDLQKAVQLVKENSALDRAESATGKSEYYDISHNIKLRKYE